MKIFVSGGAGFIGSHFIKACLRQGWQVTNYDALTYAANPQTLKDIQGNPAYRFIHGDIADRQKIADALNAVRPDAVINFAAETHVDRSIEDAAPFIHTNVNGLHSLAEAVSLYAQTHAKPGFRMVQVSTDEVFGSLGKTDAPFTETSAYNPVSPYAASKAAGDLLCLAMSRTHGLPLTIIHCGNNYGPYQFPEKLIPHMLFCALAGQSLPIYGAGENIRSWIHVDDHVRALLAVLQAPQLAERYVIGAQDEWTNLALVRHIAGLLDRMAPSANGSYLDRIEFVADRPGHDARYAIDSSKIRKDLGWQPQIAFEAGLESTLAWYLQNEAWINGIKQAGFVLQRRGEGRRL